MGGAGLSHVQDGVGLGVALAEEQEVKGQLFGEDDQVGLDVPLADASSAPPELALAGQLPQLCWMRGS